MSKLSNSFFFGAHRMNERPDTLQHYFPIRNGKIALSQKSKQLIFSYSLKILFRLRKCMDCLTSENPQYFQT